LQLQKIDSILKSKNTEISLNESDNDNDNNLSFGGTIKDSNGSPSQRHKTFVNAKRPRLNSLVIG